MAIIEALITWLISVLPVVFNWFIVALFTMGVYAVLYTVAGLFDLYEQRQRRQ